MSIIKNKNTILKYHKFKSIHDSFNALEFAFWNSSPDKLVQQSIYLDSSISITDIYENVKSFEVPNEKSVLVISVGKASEKMLIGLLHKIGNKVNRSLLIIPENYILGRENIKLLGNTQIVRSSHPVPSANSIIASRRIIGELKKMNDIKLVIFMISGGSSSLIVSPIEGISLTEKKIINKLLITSGADIREINIVRKHLSRIKGGKILRLINPKIKIIGIILSDVVGDFLDTIGSGLTSADASSFKDANNILEKYCIYDSHLKSIGRIKYVLNLGMKSKLPETLKIDEFRLRDVHNFVIGSNAKFCKFLIHYFKKAGYDTLYLGSHYNNSTSEFKKEALKIINFMKEKSCVLIGGELTNVISNKSIGIGGRNQEAVCFLLNDLKEFNSDDYTIICIGTDGIDGNSNAAGGFITPMTIDLLKRQNINIDYFIQSKNSNLLLTKLRSTITTGYTGTNFNDVYLLVRNR